MGVHVKLIYDQPDAIVNKEYGRSEVMERGQEVTRSRGSRDPLHHVTLQRPRSPKPSPCRHNMILDNAFDGPTTMILVIFHTRFDARRRHRYQHSRHPRTCTTAPNKLWLMHHSRVSLNLVERTRTKGLLSREVAMDVTYVSSLSAARRCITEVMVLKRKAAVRAPFGLATECDSGLLGNE
jgi:hypothetical protein